jgi:hypothetical protein
MGGVPFEWTVAAATSSIAGLRASGRGGGRHDLAVEV